MPYRYEIEQNDNGTWGWEVRNPEGAAICWGAMVGRRQDVEAKLNAMIKRLSNSYGRVGSRYLLRLPAAGSADAHRDWVNR